LVNRPVYGDVLHYTVGRGNNGNIIQCVVYPYGVGI